MNKIKYTLSNIFKASNTGTILFFLLNLMILFGLFSSVCAEYPMGYLVLLLCYVLSLVFSFSTIGQKLLCFINGAKKMSRLDMRERVLPVVEEVYAAAKRKTPDLPNRINVRIMYDPNPNAFAIGSNTICVTEGMLDLPDNLMAGIIAHEMGHLALQHTVIQILIGGGNLIMMYIMLIQEAMRLVFGGISLTSARRRDAGGVAGTLLAALCAGMILFWTKMCMFILSFSSRSNEYAADAYAYEIGYGDDLAEALDRLTLGTPQATLLQALTSSHPEPGERIGKLQSMGATYSRY